MEEKTYSGVNIQWPISELILSGTKTVETRTYALPEKYLDKEMILIETPGKKGNFKARGRAIVIFRKSFPYLTKNTFAKDKKRHCVEPGSIWDWKDKKKWGWEVEVVSIFKKPLMIKNRKGIVFTTNIKL